MRGSIFTKLVNEPLLSLLKSLSSLCSTLIVLRRMYTPSSVLIVGLNPESSNSMVRASFLPINDRVVLHRISTGSRPIPRAE